MGAPTVSVIIPCWEQVQYLKDAVISIMSQTMGDHEVIVVGDHDACDWASYRNIKHILDPGYGVSYARNLGIDEAVGRWVCCVDADDMLAETYLEKTVKLAESANDKDRVMVRTDMQEFGSRSGEWILPPYSKKVNSEFNNFHCATLFSKELWAAARGFDCEMIGWEDWSTWISFTAFDPEVFSVPEKLLLYRTGDNQSTPGKRDLEPYQRAMIYFKHVDMYHPNPKRYFDSIETISKMNDECLKRVDKRLSQLPHLHNLRLFSMLAHQYRNGHPKTNESRPSSTHDYPISLFTR